MRKIKQHLSMVASAGALLLAYSVTANAGASVYHDNWNDSACTERGNVKFCFVSKGVWHQVITPSGNYIYKLNRDYGWEYSYIDTGVVFYSRSFNDKRSQLFKAGEGTHLYKISDYDDYCYNGYQYSYTRTYQFVNGQVVINEYSFEPSTC